jgi:hypothetical protein
MGSPEKVQCPGVPTALRRPRPGLTRSMYTQEANTCRPIRMATLAPKG